MRFDTSIIFQSIISGEYDALTGNYKTDTVKECKKLANVIDSGSDTMNLVYGKIRKGSKTICLQNHYDGSFDYIRIGDKRYQVDHIRDIGNKQCFVVSEVL